MCHCVSCQKAQGGAFAAILPLDRDQMVFTGGETLLRAYESSPGKERLFCERCGSPILSRLTSAPERLRLRVGVLESADGLQVASHAFTGQAAAWSPIADGAPQYSGPRPA